MVILSVLLIKKLCMNLSEELKARGVSKTRLGQLLGVSRMTIQRMGENVTDEVLEVLKGYVPVTSGKRKEPVDYTDTEIQELLLRRGGLEADTNRDKETDWEICQSVGLRVWEFNEMIAGWVKRHPYRGSSHDC